jgi:hypothetical protein
MNSIAKVEAPTAFKPGIYDMPAEPYHRHVGSLSSAGARCIVNDCPAVFRYRQDNPQNKREFDIGTATHLLTLEPEKFPGRVFIVRGKTKDGKESAGYASQDAKEQREHAYALGRTPLLPDEYDLVQNMRAAVWAHPIAGKAFIGGQAEKSLFWRDPESGVMCRTRPDYLPPHTRYLVDLKTAASSDPEDFVKSAADFGYHMQAEWYLSGVESLLGERPERFAFVVVSKKPPHLVTVHWVGADALYWGSVQNRYARHVFAWCGERDEWPGYVQKIGQPGEAYNFNLPVWKLKQLQERMDAGGFEPPAISMGQAA